MESYRRVMVEVEKERANFLSKIDLVQPSFEEQHQLEWGRHYQEEELSSLRHDVDKISREVEAETKLLRDREEIIRGIQDEQRQDRIKIQTLLSLSQPVTPDITVVFQSLAPGLALPPTATPAHGARTSVSRGRGERSTARRTTETPDARPRGRRRRWTRRGVGGGDGDDDDDDCGNSEVAREGQRAGFDVDGRQHRRRSRFNGVGIGGGGGDGGGGGCGEADDLGGVETEGDGGFMQQGVGGDGIGAEGNREEEEEEDRSAERSVLDDEKEEIPPSELREPSRRSKSPAGRRFWGGARDSRHEELSEIDATRAGFYGGGGEVGTAEGGRRAGDKRGCRGSHEVAAGRDRGGRKGGKETSRLRCTLGYQQHLERRLDLNQRHLQELDRLRRAYHETLERDEQEREIQVQVQRENAALVVKSLRRRTAEVNKRLSCATDDYLRLRHNAKEAHAASAEEQLQVNKSREESEAELRRLLAAAEIDIQSTKREGRRKLDESTLEPRERLRKAEAMLQEERSHHAEIRRQHKTRVQTARDGVLRLRRRHRKLVGRRAEEVVYLSDEMSALRRGMTELERRMFAAW